MSRRLLGALVCAAFLAGCVSLSDFKWVGTFTYEGVAYPVYSAIVNKTEKGGGQTVHMLYLPNKGPKDTFGLVYTCDQQDLDDCTPEFGKALKNRFTPDNKRDEGGMDY